MFSDEVVQLAVLGLVAVAVGLVVYTLIFPYLSGEKQAEKRREQVANRSSRRQSGTSQVDELNHRRKQVQDTLKELEAKQKAKNKLTLRTRLLQAGLDISPHQFYLFSLAFGLGAAVVVMFIGLKLLIVAAVGFIGALGFPRWLLKYLTKKRQTKFTNEFANAIDVIVRGVKSGLPLNECLEIIARESPEPVRSEFAELVEQQRVGVPLGECFDRMLARLPLAEVKFFAIVIAIQQQAGGNLAEALGNLSAVLRARKRLTAKVKALSAEAKASAAILAALPFLVMGMTYVSSPEYISMLWLDRRGHMLLAAGGIWMTFGLLVMKKMINFKY